MERKTKALIAVIILALIFSAIVSFVLGTAVIAHAETIKRVSSDAKKETDSDGNRYIIRHAKKQVGLIRYRGNIYYAHRTKSALYPVGALATDCFKEIDGDWYYFGKTGKAQKRDSRYIDIRSRNSTVRSIITPGTGGTERYNTREHRYQVRNGRRWESVGMQTYPYGQMDFQP